MTELSIDAAAREVADAPAILTADRMLTFAECARLATQSHPDSVAHPGCDERIAHPAIETLIAIYRALEHSRPLALLHPRLSDTEQLRQRAALRAAQLPTDAALVLFTSGSSGHARGVVMSRHAIIAAARASAACLGWRDNDRWLLCLPLAHAGGLSIVVRCLIARKPVVLHDAAFSATAIHGLALQHRATLASLVPAQLSALLAYSPADLRAVLLGGSAAPHTLIEAAIAAGWPVRPTYGMTESFGQVATATEPGGIPRVLPGVAIAAGETLRIRGAMLATAYLDGSPIAPEFTTADIGSIDNGLVRVLGRRDDVIITGGEKVHPSVVEEALAATPGVVAACAFAIADPQWGHVVGVAVAVDATFSRPAALAHWHAVLPPHARPRRLAVLPTLPTLPSGKLNRCAIAALPSVEVRYDALARS